ncbi:MAG: hypothetical protein LBH10_03940 [Burkholderiaceae bacterium]|jgi:hypothetical protein|nr:hypothetical protein [Burkholderiaceae bacterium]
MTKQVTVNLFDIVHSDKTQSLTQTLETYASLPLDQRWRSDLRLDIVKNDPESQRLLETTVYCMSFAKGRPIGPGRLSRDTPVRDVDLGPSENFGEETAALYISNKKWFLVLHNQYGIGSKRMAEYFNALDPGNSLFDYALFPRIDQAILNKLSSMKNFVEIEVRANVGAFGETEDAIGESVAAAANQSRAMRLEIRLMANTPHKKTNYLEHNKVIKFIQSLLNKSSAGVDKLKVHCDDERLDKADRILDLIEQKINLQFSTSELQLLNHRHTFDSKIALLRRAALHWNNTLN